MGSGANSGTKMTQGRPTRGRGAGQGRRRVAGRGAGHDLRPAREGAGDPHRARPVLEGRGRVPPLVLDEEPPHAGPLRQPGRVEDRRPAGLEGGTPRPGCDRQELLVAPGVAWARPQPPRRQGAPCPREVELDLQDALGPAGRARPVEPARVPPPAPHADEAAHAAGEAHARRSRMRRSMSCARSWWATHHAGSSWARSSSTVFPCCSTQVKYFWLCQRRRTSGRALDQPAGAPRAEDLQAPLRLLGVHRALLAVEALQHGRVAVEAVGGHGHHRLPGAEAEVGGRPDRGEDVADAAGAEDVSPAPRALGVDPLRLERRLPLLEELEALEALEVVHAHQQVRGPHVVDPGHVLVADPLDPVGAEPDAVEGGALHRLRGHDAQPRVAGAQALSRRDRPRRAHRGDEGSRLETERAHDLFRRRRGAVEVEAVVPDLLELVEDPVRGLRAQLAHLVVDLLDVRLAARGGDHVGAVAADLLEALGAHLRGEDDERAVAHARADPGARRSRSSRSRGRRACARPARRRRRAASRPGSSRPAPPCGSPSGSGGPREPRSGRGPRSGPRAGR